MLARLAELSASYAVFFMPLLLAALSLYVRLSFALHLNVALSAMSKLGVAAPLGVGAILLQLTAGVAMLVGWQTRLAAVGLGIFCIATAICFHQNFVIRNELLHFEKDLAIAG